MRKKYYFLKARKLLVDTNEKKKFEVGDKLEGRQRGSPLGILGGLAAALIFHGRLKFQR